MIAGPTKALPSRPEPGGFWWLALVPIILLGLLMTYLLVTGGGLDRLAGPPVEQVSIQRVSLPEPGVIRVEVVNDGPETVTIPQVLVDDSYYAFEASPSTTIPRLGRAVFTIHYPWVEEETHHLALVTSLGLLFEAEVAVAVETPRFALDLFWLFGLVGLYVGVVPVGLGMLWYPFLRRLSRLAMSFVLTLTMGLLIYLAVGTYLDANGFAANLPAFWQGTPLVLFVALATLGVLLALGRSNRPAEDQAFGTSYRMALGIGLHNLGEGLAIGAAFAMGEAALGTFLILGFTLHNITEGLGIVAPLARLKTPAARHFAWLLLIAGGPAVLGTWMGGFTFNPVLSSIFLAIGVGAILQVVWEVGVLVAKDAARLGRPLVNWTTLGGTMAGIALMYFTAFLVKV